MAKFPDKIPFRDRHPFLVHSSLITLAFVALVVIGLLFIDVFTHHGEEIVVPELRNMPLEKAIEKLDAAGLTWEIADSTNYNENIQPGFVTDQEPKTGSTIKAIRPVYLYVNAMHPREVSFPKLIDQSLSMAKTSLHDMGFKYIEVDTVASRYESVVAVTVNGRTVNPGAGVPINAHIKLTVGNGSLKDDMPDKYITDEQSDSIERAQAQEEIELTF